VEGDLEATLEAIDEKLTDYELDEAAEALEEARSDFGAEPALVARKAELKMEEGEYRACLDLVERTDADDDSVAARLLAQKGYALFYLDREEEAREVFNEAVRRDPEYWEAIFGRALVHEYLGFPRAALLDLDRVVEMDDEEPEPFAIRGGVYLEYGEIDEAYSDLAWALEMDPYDEEARLNLARIEALEEEPNEAIETLGPLLEEGEDLNYLYPGAILRSQMLVNLKDTNSAAEDAEMAIEWVPDEPWGYLQLAACHVTASRPEDALEALDEAEARLDEPRDVPDYYQLRAAACDHLGREGEAEEYRNLIEGSARLPELVYGAALNPADHVPVNPERPLDIRSILEELFGSPEEAPEGYADKLRDLLDRVPEVAEQNPGAQEIEIELPPIQEGGPSPGEIVLERGE
jgi:tetratricopeptide (TPR) repeat protein